MTYPSLWQAHNNDACSGFCFYCVDGKFSRPKLMQLVQPVLKDKSGFDFGKYMPEFLKKKWKNS